MAVRGMGTDGHTERAERLAKMEEAFQLTGKHVEEKMEQVKQSVTGVADKVNGVADKVKSDVKTELGAVEKVVSGKIDAVEKTLKTEVSEKIGAVEKTVGVQVASVKDSFKALERVVFVFIALTLATSPFGQKYIARLTDAGSA